MGQSYGRQLLVATGRPVQVIASESEDIGWKIGGITLDWNTVAAVGSDTVLADDTTILNGQKGLRFGQILTKITLTGVDVVTINGSPTGGTFTISVTAGGSTQTTTAIAYNASAATVQAAIQALTNVGTGNATVTGSAGGPYTITFPDAIGAATVTSNGAALTGGTTPTATTAQTAPGGDLGKYGPYDPAATDGRATLARGSCYILNQTVLENGVLPALGGGVTNHPAVFEYGPVWRARLLMTAGAHSLAAGPTVAEFEAAFPGITYVQS